MTRGSEMWTSLSEATRGILLLACGISGDRMERFSRIDDWYDLPSSVLFKLDGLDWDATIAGIASRVTFGA